MTKRIFLIGHPVGHSVSPAFQQAALDHYAKDVRYEAMDVDALSLSQAVSSLRDPDVMGANVTVPHKQATVTLLDELTKEARLIGAVNTIENRDGVLIGHNTDAKGFLKALKEEAGFDPQGKTALVLGAGGAARAVVVALAGAGAKSLVVANRTLERAVALIDSLRSKLPSAEAVALHPDSLRPVAASSQLIVNCTSMGMSGGEGQGETPMTADLIPSEALVCDLVYNPRETPLMSEAAKAGARVLGGLPMLVYQGAAAFELWTGKEAPVKVMFEAAEKALMARQPVGS
ncbi:MAG: shikimate dehydrogenase [Chloroflexi bacterium]|nr:shikimate dehydrogenase [Chloroflexota bacterium]